MKVYKDSCKNCLLSRDAIVSPKTRKDILNSCAVEQSYFICHKATQAGDNVMCKSFYDNFGHISQMLRIAQRLNMVEFIEQPESEKLPSYSEMNK